MIRAEGEHVHDCQTGRTRDEGRRSKQEKELTVGDVDLLCAELIDLEREERARRRGQRQPHRWGWSYRTTRRLTFAWRAELLVVKRSMAWRIWESIWSLSWGSGAWVWGAPFEHMAGEGGTGVGVGRVAAEGGEEMERDGRREVRWNPTLRMIG